MWDERKASSATAASMPQGAPLFCLGWSPSADMIVAGSENGEVLFFDPRSIQEPLQKWEGHDDSVRRIVALPGLVPPLCRRLRLALHRSVSNVAMPLHRAVCLLDVQVCELRVLWVGGWAGNRLATASDDCHVAVLSMAAGKPELEATRKVYASPLVAHPQAALAVAPLPLAWRVQKGTPAWCPRHCPL
jgi:hypothetical protein